MSNKRTNTIEKKWQEVFTTIEGAKTDIQNRVSIEREIIPIIFVPGIMGSRLKNESGKIAWDPDSDWFMLTRYGLLNSTAKKKKLRLVGPNGFKSDYLKVIEKDPDQVKKFFKNYPKAEKRGWTGIMWSSYGTIIESLHKNMLWPELVGLCFEFPVHAFGYNWSASAKDAGMKLSELIKKTIADYKSGKNSPDKKTRMCERVIIVTHSMGGLVARSACQQLGEDADKKVLGVIHGVQPATGSPAAYWRMKAGFERPQGGPNKSAWYDWRSYPKKMFKHTVTNSIGACVLGTNGKEVTALLCNMPGGLQLLPNKEYTDNKGSKSWLNIPAKDGHIFTLPKNDPYREIYRLEDGAHRMVNPEWLEPGGGKTTSINPVTSPWKRYISYLDAAESFHHDLGMYVHSNTSQFYSSGLDSPDRIIFSRQSVVHHENDFIDNYIPFANKGSCQIYVDRSDREMPYAKGSAYILTLERPSGSGDGTVPDSSGMALKLKKGQTVKVVFENKSEWFENGHQGIYSTKKAENIVKNGIGNLAIKRIEQEIGKAKLEAIRTLYRKQFESGNASTRG